MILNKCVTPLLKYSAHVNKPLGIVCQHMIPKCRAQLIVTDQTSHAETTGIQNTIPKLNKKTKTQKKNVTKNASLDAIVEYINNIDPRLIKCIPESYIKYTTAVKNLLLIDEKSGQKFVSLIIDDLLKNPSFVVQASAGLGIMTTILLDAGVPFIHMYEDSAFFRNRLENLVKKFPDKLDIRNYNFLRLSKIMYVDNMTNNQYLQDALKGIPKVKWENETCMQIIATIHTDRFIRQIIMNIIFNNCIMVYGRPVIYAAIKPTLWNRYTVSPDRFVGTTTVLFHLFFNAEKLGEISRKSYLPWENAKTIKDKNKQKLFDLDAEVLYIVKIEPKTEIFTHIISQKDLVPFWHFLRHNLIMRKKRVIPELEKLIPDCGIRLIMMDYDIYTEFGDLSPTQLLNLYKELKTWPEFEECAFLDSVDSVLSKMNENLISNTDHDLQ